MKRSEKYNKRHEEQPSTPKKVLRVLKTVKNVVCWVLIVILVFTVVTFLLERSMGGTPSVFGYTLHRVVSGSMEPELSVGDVLLNKDISGSGDIQVGDIITFKGGARFNNQKVTHRVFVPPYMDDSGEWVLITKGDANNVDDGEIKLSSVESKVVTKVGILTRMYAFFFSPWGLIIFIALLILIFFDEVMNLIRLSSRKYDDDSDEESIGEIIERIQREDAEKAEKKRRKKESPEDTEKAEETAE